MDTDFGGGVGELEWGIGVGMEWAGSLGGDCGLSVGGGKYVHTHTYVPTTTRAHQQIIAGVIGCLALPYAIRSGFGE